MLADVANLARGARGFLLADGATRFLEPGAHARLDLADHVLHRAWAAAGEVVIISVAEGSRVLSPQSVRSKRADQRGRSSQKSA